MIGQIFKRIWLGWKRIANLIGRFNTHILLTFFYFFVIGFIFLVKRIMSLFSSKTHKNSYWILREEGEDKSNFERQF